MRLNSAIFLIVTFCAAVLCIPMIALLGKGAIPPPARPAANSGSQAPGSEASGWPYSTSNPVSSPGVDEPSAAAKIEELSLDFGDNFTYYDSSDNKVKTVSARDYVRGALAVEMPASFSMDALKAQAVSAHTYALYCAEKAAETGNPDIKGADFKANPLKREGFITEAQAREFFGSDFDYYWARICEAADSVFDRVVVYEGEPILAAYHASSVGMTEAAENVWPSALPYLIPVESEGDPVSPGFKAEVKMTDDEVKSALLSYFDDISLGDDPAEWIEPLEFSASGYMTLARVGDIEVHGSDVRFALSLRSTAIDINYDDGFTFTTTGYGHGVGLSQQGADYMAKQGMSYDEILLHYYPGANMATLK